ncbi:MAG: hypothetical protein Q4E59_00900 [Bacteroidales bacterium]|nr:hypothetical protein [Bacteroidales bacterium]
MLKDRITLLIHSCEKFSDLWPAHTTLLNRNWPSRDFESWILTDAPSEVDIPDVKVVSAGIGKEITERIRYALPLLQTEYVLVTLDDYFLTSPISSERIERLVDIMNKEGWDYLRLFDRPKCPEKKTLYENICTFEPEGDYRVNLYSGIWRKSFMEATLGDIEMNAWNFEVSLTKKAAAVGGKCAVSHGNEFPILDVVRKGRILHKAHKYLQKHDLYHGSRPLMPLWAEYKLNIRTFFARLFAKLPKPLYDFTIKIMLILGVQSFKAQARSRK